MYGSDPSRHRFTIMLIPHSDRRVVNFQISTFVLVFLGLLLALLVAGFTYLATVYTGSSTLVEQTDLELGVTEANLDQVLREVNNLLLSYDVFEGELSETLRSLDISQLPESEFVNGDGDLADIVHARQVNPDDIRQISQLQDLQQGLSSAIQPLADIADLLATHEALLAEIPHHWPIINGGGQVTMEFGPNTHPIRNYAYLHKGIDIYADSGTGVVAAANGKVIDTGLDTISGYGRYIKIDHRYGFETQYSHLQQVYVQEGENVHQGQLIGAVGNTGLSTNPHLDFIIRLGTELLDPSAFLQIRNTFNRWMSTNTTRR